MLELPISKFKKNSEQNKNYNYSFIKSKSSIIGITKNFILKVFL
jgi:hypothetical protein